MIADGIRFTGMPAFAAEETSQEIWDLVPLLRRLATLSPEELREMERMTTNSMPMEPDNSGGEDVPSHAHEEN